LAQAFSLSPNFGPKRPKLSAPMADLASRAPASGSDTQGVCSEDEELVSIVGQAPPLLARRPRRQRVAAAGAALALGLVGIVAWRRVRAPCTEAAISEQTFDALLKEFLADEQPLEADKLDPVVWLQAASEAGQATDGEDGVGTSGAELARKAADAVRAALSSPDPKDSKLLVDKAMKKAMDRAFARRKKVLARYFALKRTGLRRNGTTTQSPSQRNSDASCTLDVFQIVTILATFGSNINDATKTCEPDKNKRNLVRQKVCTVNLAGAISNLMAVGTSIAAATSECSISAVPSIEAVCSASITSLIGSIAALGGAFALINSACSDSGWYNLIPEGTTPSDVGSANMAPLKTQRRLEESAPPRQLLFGGGKDSLATQCATQASNIAWALAALIQSFNSAINENMPNSCPPRNIVNGTNQPEGLLYKFSQGACSLDVMTIISGFLSIAVFGQLMATTCTDELNLEAICGSGISGTFAGAVRIAAAGTAMWIGCDVGLTPEAKELEAELRKAEKEAQYAELMGRRLANSGAIQALKDRYESPAEVWKELGFDLEDPNALWRQYAKRREPRAEDFANFVPDEAGESSAYSALFGQTKTCGVA